MIRARINHTHATHLEIFLPPYSKYKRFGGISDDTTTVLSEYSVVSRLAGLTLRLVRPR